MQTPPQRRRQPTLECRCRVRDRVFQFGFRGRRRRALCQFRASVSCGLLQCPGPYESTERVRGRIARLRPGAPPVPTGCNFVVSHWVGDNTHRASGWRLGPAEFSPIDLPPPPFAVPQRPLGGIGANDNHGSVFRNGPARRHQPYAPHRERPDRAVPSLRCASPARSMSSAPSRGNPKVASRRHNTRSP